MAGASRFARGEAVVPDPLADPAGYIEAISDLIATWEIRVLLPITEPSLLAVLPARQKLGVAIPFPNLDTFLSISDKERLLAVAPQQGIAVPRQWTIASAEDIADAQDQPISFPLVIKPSRSIGGAETSPGGRVKLSVDYAGDFDELRVKLTALPEAAYPVLLQQRVVGPGIGVFLLVWEGELLAAFAHRRLRE
jgi:predicted ATP-grasp superfamily ATP-dependent carboligase